MIDCDGGRRRVATAVVAVAGKVRGHLVATSVYRRIVAARVIGQRHRRAQRVTWSSGSGGRAAARVRIAVIGEGPARGRHGGGCLGHCQRRSQCGEDQIARVALHITIIVADRITGKRGAIIAINVGKIAARHQCAVQRRSNIGVPRRYPVDIRSTLGGYATPEENRSRRTAHRSDPDFEARWQRIIWWVWIRARTRQHIGAAQTGRR